MFLLPLPSFSYFYHYVLQYIYNHQNFRYKSTSVTVKSVTVKSEIYKAYQKLQTSSYKINKHWACIVQCDIQLLYM